MDDSSRERFARRAELVSALTLGFALGAIVLAGGSLVLFDTVGLRTATTGLVATALVALAAGMWAGAPPDDADELPLRERWMGAALAAGGAGAFATYMEINDAFARATVGRMSGLLFLIAIPLYLLAMVVPVLLAWARGREEDDDGSRTAVGRLTLGILGGMALGILASGLLLLPQAGAGPLLLGMSALLLVPLLLREPEDDDAVEQVVFETETPFHELRVTEVVYPAERQPERRLYLNGEEESGELVRSGAPTLAYVAAAEGWITQGAPRGGSYLFLGGGAYTLPRRVAERDPRSRVTVVELDPEVTSVAYHFFGLRPEHRVRSVHGDARAFLDRSGGQPTYDRIYIDVYGGQESLPYPLVTREAFAAALGLLNAGGIAAINVIGVTHGPEARRLWSVVRTFVDVFPSVALYTHLGPDYPERQNLLLAGSADAVPALGTRAGLFEPWPSESWPDLSDALVYRDLFPDDGEGGAYEKPPRSQEQFREPRGERSARRL